MTAADIGAGELPGAPLGHATDYPDHYAPAQLYPVARAPQRAHSGFGRALPFAASINGRPTS